MKNFTDLFLISTLKHCFPGASSISVSSTGSSRGYCDHREGLDVTEKPDVTS